MQALVLAFILGLLGQAVMQYFFGPAIDRALSGVSTAWRSFSEKRYRDFERRVSYGLQDATAYLDLRIEAVYFLVFSVFVMLSSFLIGFVSVLLAFVAFTKRPPDLLSVSVAFLGIGFGILMNSYGLYLLWKADLMRSVTREVRRRKRITTTITEDGRTEFPSSS